MIEREEQKDYTVFLGGFGSGKTELALHFALASVQAGLPTILVDLDIINPYFRASERQDCLEKRGIRLISPYFAMSNVEIITINPEIYAAFAGGAGTVIFDVGGDNVGARALGQYHDYFRIIPPQCLKVWLVINPRRPLTATLEKIIALIGKIEHSARLSITGLINNGNISYETSGEDLVFAYGVVREVSRRTGIPLVMTVGEERPLKEFLSLSAEKGLEPEYIGKPVTIRTRMHRDWQRLVEFGV